MKNITNKLIFIVGLFSILLMSCEKDNSDIIRYRITYCNEKLLNIDSGEKFGGSRLFTMSKTALFFDYKETVDFQYNSIESRHGYSNKERVQKYVDYIIENAEYKPELNSYNLTFTEKLIEDITNDGDTIYSDKWAYEYKLIFIKY